MPRIPKFILKLWERIGRTEVSLIAAGIAFFCFLAIFPAIAAVITIWSFAFDPMVIQTQLDQIESYLPGEAFDLIYGQVQRLLAANSRSLGFATLLSTVFAIWSARAGVSALIGGMNTIHEFRPRSRPRHVAWSLALTFALVLVALCAMALTVIVPLILNLLPLGPLQSMLLDLVNFGLGLLLVTMAIALTYRLAPNWPRKKSRPPLFTWGLLVALILWAAASRGFVFYLANFASYNQIYGSIGAVVALLMWLYLSAFAVLLGAAVDAEYQETKDQ